MGSDSTPPLELNPISASVCTCVMYSVFTFLHRYMEIIERPQSCCICSRSGLQDSGNGPFGGIQFVVLSRTYLRGFGEKDSQFVISSGSGKLHAAWRYHLTCSWAPCQTLHPSIVMNLVQSLKLGLLNGDSCLSREINVYLTQKNKS